MKINAFTTSFDWNAFNITSTQFVRPNSVTPAPSGIRLNALSHDSAAHSAKCTKQKHMQQSQCLCAINERASPSLTPRFSEVELRSTDTSTVLTVFLLSFLTSDRISKRKLHNSLLNLRGPSSKVTKQLAVFLQRVEQFLALHTSRIFFPLTINFLYPH